MTEKLQRYALVGMKHRGAETFVAELPPDEPLILIREPNNRFDRNAVQVWARDRHVGSIAKTQNAILARFIDEFGDTARTDDAGTEKAVFARKVAARLHKGNNEWPLVEIA